MANQYVVPAKDVQLWIKVGDLPSIRIETGISNNFTYGRTLQDIFAIGEEDPIDTIGTNSQYTATLSLQSGEYQTVLDAINGVIPATQAPYATWNQFESFTISKTMYMRNAAIPKTITESIVNCLVENTSADVNRNDAETIHNLSLRGNGVRRTVAPLV